MVFASLYLASSVFVMLMVSSIGILTYRSLMSMVNSRWLLFILSLVSSIYQ